jgi:prepilin-type N-terminal cleavage/methylation domain-containing protein
MSNKGWTLIELVIVIIILSLLASVALPSISGHLFKAQTQEFFSGKNDFEQSLHRWREEYLFGQYAKRPQLAWSSQGYPLVESLQGQNQCQDLLTAAFEQTTRWSVAYLPSGSCQFTHQDTMKSFEYKILIDGSYQIDF